MAKTYREQYEDIMLQIAKAEEAQSYSIGSRSLTRAPIKEMYIRANWLKAMADREDNGNALQIKYLVR